MSTKDNTDTILKVYLQNPGIPLPKVAACAGIGTIEAVSAIAKAALEGRYVASGLVFGGNESVRREIFMDLVRTGSIVKASEKHKVKQRSISDWLRPVPHLKPEDLPPSPVPDDPVPVAMFQPETTEALTEVAINALQREDQLQADITLERTELAKELYQKAKHFWHKAMECSEVQDFRVSELKTLVLAASTAVKDAQLLAGAPTERVEGFLQQVSMMSREELIQFVYEPVEPRPLLDREDVRILEAKAAEVLDAPNT